MVYFVFENIFYYGHKNVQVGPGSVIKVPPGSGSVNQDLGSGYERNSSRTLNSDKKATGVVLFCKIKKL
jgi:hypothetical protein